MTKGLRRSVPALLLLLGSAAAAHADSAPAPRAPFAKGSRYWSVSGAVSRKPSLAWLALTQLTASYYPVDDLAIVCGGEIGYLDADRTSAGAIGGLLMGMRWHFAPYKRLHPYVEGLVGVVYQRHPITPNSLRFNFDLQGGGGAAYRLNKNTLLAGGVRLHHLSNARVHGKNHNLGYDAPMLYLECLKAF